MLLYSINFSFISFFKLISDSGNINIEVFDESENYEKQWNTDKKSNESK